MTEEIKKKPKDEVTRFAMISCLRDLMINSLYGAVNRRILTPKDPEVLKKAMAMQQQAREQYKAKIIANAEYTFTKPEYHLKEETNENENHC